MKHRPKHRRRHRHAVHLVNVVILLLQHQPGAHSFFVQSLRHTGFAGHANACRSARAASTGLRASDKRTAERRFEGIGDLEALTVVQLRSELKARGLKQTGKKADLVHLLANTPGVLSDEVRSYGNERDDRQGTRATSFPAQGQDTASESGGPSPAAVAESIPEPEPEHDSGVPSRSVLSSDLILDAELAPGVTEAETASLDEEGFEEALGVGEDDYSPSSSFGEEFEETSEVRNRLPDGFHRIGGRSTPSSDPLPTVLPMLPPPTDEMQKRQVIVDLLDRRETGFELRDGPLERGSLPYGNVYTVCTKRALRPWDGPHADRAETHVVVLLSDVYGWEDSFTRHAADQVADMCNAIVLVPDLFRKRPWSSDNAEEDYERWRASHDPDQVAADIRSCVAYARAEYKPTSLGLMGFCFGGGRALEEAAAGVVKPDNVVVFYPTRYAVEHVGSSVACPVAAFFAEHDVLPGATVDDAIHLRQKLLSNQNVPDAQVKLCPGADHGFAHRPMTKDRENAEDAMLLATSWLEVYLQKHFPPKAKAAKEDEFEFWALPARKP